MKSRQNQSGSAHVVIIVILILALLGTLGFVFWQNFIQKKDTAPTTTTTSAPSTAPATATTTAPKTTATSLAISSYSVEVPYDSTTDTYTLAPATTGGFAGGYTIYSKKVTDACGSSVNVGVVKRFNKGDSIPSPNNQVTLGNYIYALGVGGYGDCGTGAGMTVLDNASSAFGTAFNGLRATK
jgi:hypothetical protein